MILDQLHPLLKVDHAGLVNSSRDLQRLAASPEALHALEAAFPHVPSDYLDIIRGIDGVRLEYKQDGKYIFDLYILSVAEALVYSTRWYAFLAEEMPGCFFFSQADDCSYLVGESQGRAGVYRIETSVPLWEYAEYIAPSIRAMLCEGVGWSEDEL